MRFFTTFDTQLNLTITMKTFLSLSSVVKSLSVLALFFMAAVSAQAQYAYVTNNTTADMSVQVRGAWGCTSSQTCWQSVVTAAPGVTDIQVTCGGATDAIGARVNADGCVLGFGSVLTSDCSCSIGVSSDTDTFTALGSCANGYSVDQKIEIIADCVDHDIYITINEIP